MAADRFEVVLRGGTGRLVARPLAFMDRLAGEVMLGSIFSESKSSSSNARVAERLTGAEMLALGLLDEARASMLVTARRVCKYNGYYNAEWLYKKGLFCDGLGG